jgi:phage gp36-like protein
MIIDELYIDEQKYYDIKNICSYINIFHSKNCSNKDINNFRNLCLSLQREPLSNGNFFLPKYDGAYWFEQEDYFRSKGNKYLENKKIEDYLCLLVAIAENDEHNSGFIMNCFKSSRLEILLYYIAKRFNPMKDIPKILTVENIYKTIDEYLKLINEIKNENFDNSLEFIKYLKNGKVGMGPYPFVSFFEAANCIMTDLVILNGVKMLLEGYIPEISFKEYHVNYGNKEDQEFDIIVKSNLGTHLIGESFHVSKSLFKSKRRKSLMKLRQNQNLVNMSSIKLKSILIYNKEAVNNGYIPKLNKNEYFLEVELN